jgi:solute carrier family 25 (mitochondrial thiamine pyrophosphate transporter), member 19
MTYLSFHLDRFVIAPLDVVKIRQQLQVHHWKDVNQVSGPTYRGILSTVKTIARDEGMTALWKGNVSAELLYVAYGGSQFYVYQHVQEVLKSSSLHMPHSSHAFVSGACAGGFATVVTYPLDCLRTRFAAQGNERVYHSLSQAVKDIYSQEGPRGFFRGLSTALLQIVPNLAIFFGAYEPLRGLYADVSPPELSGWGSAVAGGAAGVIAKTAVFPLDLVRKRLQVQGATRSKYVHKNIPVYTGAFRALREIVRYEGIRGPFKGLAVSLVKAAPNSAVTMFVYERVYSFLHQ